MIYIDPPYNTGNDFIYDDNFSMSREDYEEEAGERDEEGNAMFDEEKWRQNSSSSGRYHSEWLSMMYPRLKLAKNLLKDDGVIFISCDDVEVVNLRRMCEETFGSNNFIAAFAWKSRVSEDVRAVTGVSDDYEYILCFSKGPGVRLKGVPKDLSKFTNPDKDPRGPWRSADMTGLATKDKRPNLHYDLTNPETGITYSCPDKGWRFDRAGMDKRIRENRILWPESDTGRPRQKLFMEDMQDAYKSISSFIDSSFASTSQGTKELKSLMGAPVFDFPKPTKLIQLLCDQITSECDIVVDFFSGSAPTPHAVINLNSIDGGRRQFIAVQIPEPCDENSEAAKAGLSTIAEVGKERIRCAGAKIKDEIRRMKDEGKADDLFDEGAPRKSKTSSFNIHPSYLKNPEGLDTGFRVLKLLSEGADADRAVKHLVDCTNFWSDRQSRHLVLLGYLYQTTEPIAAWSDLRSTIQTLRLAVENHRA